MLLGKGHLHEDMFTVRGSCTELKVTEVAIPWSFAMRSSTSDLPLWTSRRQDIVLDDTGVDICTLKPPQHRLIESA